MSNEGQDPNPPHNYPDRKDSIPPWLRPGVSGGAGAGVGPYSNLRSFSRVLDYPQEVGVVDGTVAVDDDGSGVFVDDADNHEGGNGSDDTWVDYGDQDDDEPDWYDKADKLLEALVQTQADTLQRVKGLQDTLRETRQEVAWIHEFGASFDRLVQKFDALLQDQSDITVNMARAARFLNLKWEQLDEEQERRKPSLSPWMIRKPKKKLSDIGESKE